MLSFVECNIGLQKYSLAEFIGALEMKLAVPAGLLPRQMAVGHRMTVSDEVHEAVVRGLEGNTVCQTGTTVELVSTLLRT